MIQERVTQEELILYEILRHPVLCGEFINSLDRLEWEEEFEFTWYQREVLCDFNSYVSMCCARAVGKTVVISNMFIWILINNIYPGDYVVYTVPNKVHLEPVFTSLIRMFRSNSLLKNFVEKRRGINSSEHSIEVTSGSKLICRIAGQSGTGANVIGLHTPFVAADELGYYPWGTWQELQPTINSWTDGFRVIGSGVPTGLRENNVLYHIDQENSSYTKHRVSAFENPRFSEDDEIRAIEQYGGKESDDYIHLVLGEHGAPVFAVFDRRLFQIGVNPVYKLVINGIKFQEDISQYASAIATFPQVPANQGVIFGIDLGYTDPTAIAILYIDKNGQIRFHGRLRLNKVSYSIQDRFIDLLDSKFKPGIIGVDEGASGKAVIQRLQGADEFIHKDYIKRLIPVNFSSWFELGFDNDGKPIKQKTKPFSVSVLQEYSNSHKLVYSSTDQEMIAELERMTYSKTPAGDIIYKTLTPKGGQRGEDHFTAALLCGILAYYIENESILPRRKQSKLFMPRWVLST